MLGSSEADPEGGQWAAWVTGVLEEGGGQVDRPGAAERADDQVAQAGHDLRTGRLFSTRRRDEMQKWRRSRKLVFSNCARMRARARRAG